MYELLEIEEWLLNETLESMWFAFEISWTCDLLSVHVIHLDVKFKSYSLSIFLEAVISYSQILLTPQYKTAPWKP